MILSALVDVRRHLQPRIRFIALAMEQDFFRLMSFTLGTKCIGSVQLQVGHVARQVMHADSIASLIRLSLS